MKRFIFSIAVFLALTFVAAAQTANTSPSPSTSSNASPSPSAAANLREQIKDTHQEIIDIRQQAAGQIRSIATSSALQIKEKRDALKLEIQNSAAQLQQTIAAKREELKTKIETQKQQLQEKLKQIKDQVKQNIVIRINDRLTALNNLMVDHFLAVLSRLDTILNNIGSRADKAESAGLDVSAVRTAISDAQKAISASRDAVKAQAAKTYPITIATTNASTTENNLKIYVGKARQALHADLVAVRATVFAAREAVHKAATALAQIQGIDDIKTGEENPSASSSPSATPSASPSATPSASPTGSNEPG
jgi:hypothetical protein